MARARLVDIVPPSHRRGCIVTILLVPVEAVLNLAGAAALVPVMLLVLDADKLRTSALGQWADSLGIAGDASFPLLVIGGVTAALILKLLLSLLIALSRSKYLLSLYRNLSSRLFLSLYTKGLVYVKNHNSARMTYNVIGVCHNFITGYLGGWVRLVGEILFVLLLFGALAAYSPESAVVTVCVFLPVLLLYLLAIRKPLSAMSRKENNLRRDQYRLLSEAFRGYGEVTVNSAFRQIWSKFDSSLAEISGYRVRSSVIQAIPSCLLELAVLVAVALLSLPGIISQGASSPASIGVLAVALLKLLPSAKGIMNSIASVTSTAYSREILADLADFRAEMPDFATSDTVGPMLFEREISVENLKFSFPDSPGPVFDGLSFSLKKGESIGIGGRTGSGKTTLLNLLLGLYEPDGGRITVDGVPLSPDNVASWHKTVGYVSQEVFVADASILENVAFGQEAGSIDRQAVRLALERSSLAEFVDSLPDGVNTVVGESGCRLSGGQRQRLGIARALYRNASVLIFDEATSSLDTVTENEVNQAIGRLSREMGELTMIVVAHRESTLALCDRIQKI